jgi:glucosylceramidase
MYCIIGIEYGIIRVPIGCTDFSLREYSYDNNTNDFNLSKFSLAAEDYIYKMRLIKEAQALSSKSIKIFASPWTAPPWMKTNNDYKGNGMKGKGAIYMYF